MSGLLFTLIAVILAGIGARDQVTVADVQRVAQSYFKDDQLTIARLVPQPLDDAELAARAKRAEAVQAGGRH